jgi:hypothetical protein
VTIFCVACNKTFEQAPLGHLQGHGCSRCYGNNKKTTEEFVEEAIQVHGTLYNYDETEYINASTPVSIWCNDCNDYFMQAPTNHIHQQQGCPNCKYKTEKMARNIVEEITGLKFPKLYPIWTITEKYTKGLQLDLYNDEYKIAIEVDGIQHFKFTPFFHGTEDDFKSQQERDSDKDKLCKQNNVKLLRMDHTYTYRNRNKMYKFINKLLFDCGLLKQLEDDDQLLLIDKFI